MIKTKASALFIGVTLQTLALGQALDFMTINAMGRCIAAAQIAKAEMVIRGNARNAQTYERISFNLQQKIYESAKDENQRQAISNLVQSKLSEYGYMGDTQQLRYAIDVLDGRQCFDLAYSK
jgi:hypothetical protein